MGAESRLVNFYRGGVDGSGRRLADILQWDHDSLEGVHDYIQWIFPLRERSMANPSAPVLSAEDVQAFRNSPELRQRMIDALEMMRAFYRLDTPTPRHWLEPFNHNYLRLTRILRSLRTLGLEPEARRLFDDLAAIYREHAEVIGPATYGHWQRAMTDDIAP